MRLLRPNRVRNSVVVGVLGLVLLVVGCGLSFKRVIEPWFENLGGLVERVVSRFVPKTNLETAMWLLGGAFLFLGCYMMFKAVKSFNRHIMETINPGLKGGLIDTYNRRQELAQGPRIVALGGGTGLSTLLRGLKQYSSNITAIVTVSDDGGSSGRLVQEKAMIPPGDMRNCLVALADAEKAMTDLFQHRFTEESGSLSGHAVGNLLIAALYDQAHGDFEKAIELASDVLAIRGRVIPSTLDHVRLRAVMEGGLEICGETAIVQSGMRIRRVVLDPVEAQPYEEAVKAIEDADLICIGPGSVFTSVIPNLLVSGIGDVIKNSDAKRVYICNVMTQRGESDAFTASEHITAIQASVDLKLFDTVVVNTGVPSEQALGKYREAKQYLVDADIDRIRAMGYRVLSGDFMNESDLVRHDPMRLAGRIMGLVNR
jgi:uncharacterized cofD-like protein